ncbi:NADH-quinone oxidoreductase subunit C [Coralloluteibacterium stylophorae]|uniref:NADH-quinone oxidoreductase subunit C n=1 Tax=Coralloluteibacterium stylophorae TaxID=1776034 RepID=A0A8J8AZ98_9GAMM|nr:NADH-quinone oxidoreductase subunit C [Coralloluteibacterium stylophorae]MBS7457598.1 NADH-quinone oxidoreductase subunit C [Coralloluteibacterium stylophorae]
MAEPAPSFPDRLRAFFGARVLALVDRHGELTLEVAAADWIDVARSLRDEPEFRFEQLMDLCGVDYLSYGQAEWDTTDVSSEGFSRGVEGRGPGRFSWEERPTAAGPERRFAVVAHLLSVSNNLRLRVRCFAQDNTLPVVPSLIDVWPGVNWFEREAFDLFGVIFEGHPDLRRLLTDYGFVGHPFRKDFPLIGNVEVRYDAEKKRVIYEPVSIEPRVGVPRVVREDSRWAQAEAETGARSGHA